MGEAARTPGEGGRISVAQLMVAVGVVAMVLGALRGGPVGWAVCNLVLLSIIVRFALLERLGAPCPSCGRRTLGRVAVRPFGARYYRCSSCGRRRKRSILGAWSDPKGPVDEAIYRRRLDEGRWADAPAPADESGPQGQLLQGKRDRESHPEVEPLDDLPEGGLIVPGEPAPGPSSPMDLPSDPARTPGRLLQVKRRRAAPRREDSS